MNDVVNRTAAILDTEKPGPHSACCTDTDQPQPSRLLVVGSIGRQELASLQQAGYSVEVALCASSARTGFDRFSPDLVAISQNLPDGFCSTLAAFFRRRSPACVLLMLADAVNVALLLQAMRSGINDVLTRPLTAEQLEQSVARLARPCLDAEPLSPVLDRRIAQLVGIPVPTIERALIQHTLMLCRDNRARAARMLGLPRRTFYDRLGQYGLDSPQPERVAANADGNIYPHR